MTNELTGKVIAIPSARTALGERIVDVLLGGENRLVLGASPAQFQALDAQIDGRDNAYCQPIELDRPNSVTTFFQIAFSQLGKVDIVVVEPLPARMRRMTAQRTIELATRRFLHCLDAVLPYAANELHIISIDADYGPAVIPIARAFLGAKFAANGDALATRVRLSVVCPSASVLRGDVSFARTLVHVMNEPHCPDITETILMPPRRKNRVQRRTMMAGAAGKTNSSLQ